MHYKSTRGLSFGLSFEDAVMAGLAPDGGLYIPHSIPSFPSDFLSAWRHLSFADLAVEIFSLFISESEVSREDLRHLAHRSFSTFRHPEVAPVVPLNQFNKECPNTSWWILELWHGPTFAFKDVALQFLGNLFEFFLARKNKLNPKERAHITVVGATSGDTGSAAIYGLMGKQNVEVFILYPKGRVSPIQELQMTTVLEPNVHNLMVRGTFDDCQNAVKQMFNNAQYRSKYRLAAINSINWARILAQIVYYVHSYFQLLNRLPHGTVPDYCVPTGNFGDILAGYYAKRMGLPIGKLIAASNANDVVPRFFASGVYAPDSRGAKQTVAPAMDITVSSNFERLLYYLAEEAGPASKSSSQSDSVQRDRYRAASSRLAGWMQSLSKEGKISVTSAEHAVAQRDFGAGMVSDKEALQCIRSLRSSYILDPHTAMGVVLARRIYERVSPGSHSKAVVILSTAHAAKFPEVGGDISEPNELKALRGKPTRKQECDVAAVPDTVAEVLAKKSSLSAARL